MTDAAAAYDEFKKAQAALEAAYKLIEQAQHALAHAQSRARLAERREERAWDEYVNRPVGLR